MYNSIIAINWLAATIEQLAKSPFDLVCCPFIFNKAFLVISCADNAYTGSNSFEWKSCFVDHGLTGHRPACPTVQGTGRKYVSGETWILLCSVEAAAFVCIEDQFRDEFDCGLQLAESWSCCSSVLNACTLAWFKYKNHERLTEAEDKNQRKCSGWCWWSGY